MCASSTNHDDLPAATGAQSATVTCGQRLGAARISWLICAHVPSFSTSVTQTTCLTPAATRAFITWSSPAAYES